MTKEELLELKAEIEEAQTEATKLQGRKDVLLEQLKKKWKVEDLKGAKSKLKIMQKNLDTLDDKIDKEIEILETQLDEQDSDNQE